MFTCKSCGALIDSHSFHYHSCPGFVMVREPEAEQEPGYGDTPSRVLWNVRQLRKEVAELRAILIPEPLVVRMGFDDSPQHPDRLALAAHWAEHD